MKEYSQEYSKESIAAWERTIERLRRSFPEYVSILEATEYFPRIRQMFLLGYINGQVSTYQEVNANWRRTLSGGRSGVPEVPRVDDARTRVRRLWDRLSAPGRPRASEPPADSAPG